MVHYLYHKYHSQSYSAESNPILSSSVRIASRASGLSNREAGQASFLVSCSCLGVCDDNQLNGLPVRFYKESTGDHGI